MGATRARDGPNLIVLGVLYVSYETNRSSLDRESNISRSFRTALHLTGNVKPAPHENNALLHDILLWICTHARNHLDYIYYHCCYQEESIFSKCDWSFLSLLINVV